MVIYLVEMEVRSLATDKKTLQCGEQELEKRRQKK